MGPAKVGLGAGAGYGFKRGFNYISDTRATAQGVDEDDVRDENLRRRQKRRRPLPKTGRVPSAGKMGFLTYRRQITSKRGRSRRVVRKLARAQRRKRLDGSSSSLLQQCMTLTFPSKHTSATLADGDCTRGLFVPSLARLIQAANRVRDVPTGTVSAQIFVQLIKSRYEICYTPNWPDHSTAALGVTVEMSLFRLKQRYTLGNIINVPSYSGTTAEPVSYAANRQGGYWNAMPKQQTGTSITVGTSFADYFEGISQRFNKDNADTEDPTITQGNKNRYLSSIFSWLDSPGFNAVWEFQRTQTVYIPYGQSMQQTFVLPGCNISYRDLDIAYDYPAAPTSDLDVTPYLPRGWPMLAFKVTRHFGSESISSTGFSADDAMCVNMRHFWRMPEYLGRSLEHLDQTQLPWPNKAAAGTTSWVQPFTA